MSSTRNTATTDRPTFCRLCEAYCGIVATVENNRVTSIKPDKDNPHSQGHVCVKGMAAGELTNDLDRLLTPMKRNGRPGEFVPVGWDEAMDDIASRLKLILDRDGGNALALYHGNPLGFATDFVMAVKPFLAALGAHKRYHSGSQDHHAHLASNFYAYGDAERNALPDFVNCDFLVTLGANPLVSNGSLVFSPRMRHDLDAIAARGRVVVVDPRKTETARRYEHVPIQPAGDLWLLLGMLRTLIEEQLVDSRFIAERATGWDELRDAALSVAMDEAEDRSGVQAEVIRSLARDFARAPRAALYGRLGTCRGPHGTLTTFLIHAINIVAGKFGQPGGRIFGMDIFAGTETGTLHDYRTGKSRIGDVVEVCGTLPGAMLPADLMEEGQGRIRAMLLFGANPVLSSPGGQALVEGLEGLELLVSCDLYINESNRYADYILPGLTFLERDDIPLFGLLSLMRPFVQYSEAVVPPAGEARGEYTILVDLAARLGKDIATTGRPLDAFDEMLRRGPAGDRFGERDGWSFERLRRHPHGVMVDLPDPTVGWEEKIGYPDRKLRLWHQDLAGELRRAHSSPTSASGQLRLTSRRDIRSMNSWLHNIESLTRSQTPVLLINPADAAERQIGDGDLVTISTRFGAVTVPAMCSEDMIKGAVCYPHGWGHEGGWKVANAKRGENINLLLGFGADTVEKLAGMTLMDGLPVEVERVAKDAERA